jgi:zinc transport system ATP-binding protein
MPKSSATTSSELDAIAVDHLSVVFGDNVVLHDVSFAVKQGEVAAIIGPNGSGKTTLLKAILGLVPTTEGSIRVFGQHLHSVRRLIGYAPQRFDFDRQFPITVREFMDLARHPHTPAGAVAEKIKDVGLAPRMLDELLGSLSGGQLQRVLIAQAILNDPSILFLDEPASGIDIAGEATFYEIIEHLNREHRTTVLLVSHDLAMVSKTVDNVICVSGSLLCYGPPNVALTAKKLKELFGDHRYYEHGSHPGEHPHGKNPLSH